MIWLAKFKKKVLIGKILQNKIFSMFSLGKEENGNYILKFYWWFHITWTCSDQSLGSTAGIHWKRWKNYLIFHVILKNCLLFVDWWIVFICPKCPIGKGKGKDNWPPQRVAMSVQVLSLELPQYWFWPCNYTHILTTILYL